MRNLCLSVLAVLAFSLPVLAHDGSFGSQTSPIDVALGDNLQFQHNEPPVGTPQDQFKGWAYVTVQNSGNQPWGDFHFQIFGPQVYFTDTVPFTFWSTIPGATYNITADRQGADFYFYGSPVQPGGVAQFAVYTDNTALMNSFFGLGFWATPVPEPISLTLLTLSGLFLARRRK